MYERTLRLILSFIISFVLKTQSKLFRLCRFDNKEKLSSQNKLEEIKVNKAKLVEYSKYCKQRNKRFINK
jgi:hypothetical protein